MGSHFHIEFIDLNINCTVLPVSHDDHVVGGSPEGVDHGGVAGDHHDAGDDEGHDQLVPGEVHPAQENKWDVRAQGHSSSHPKLSSLSLQ